MITEIEQKFYKAFDIECNISYHQQFNGAQILRGLEFYKERVRFAEKGFIKIWHKMLNPRSENDCIYWGEYHYPTITLPILLELTRLCFNCDFSIHSKNLETFKEKILSVLTYNAKDKCIYTTVRKIMGVENDN